MSQLSETFPDGIRTIDEAIEFLTRWGFCSQITLDTQGIYWITIASFTRPEHPDWIIFYARQQFAFIDNEARIAGTRYEAELAEIQRNRRFMLIFSSILSLVLLAAVLAVLFLYK